MHRQPTKNNNNNFKRQSTIEKLEKTLSNLSNSSNLEDERRKKNSEHLQKHRFSFSASDLEKDEIIEGVQ